MSTTTKRSRGRPKAFNPSPEQTTIQALDLALATLDKLHESGLDPTMLESGKSYVQGQYPLALETSAQWA